jgi:archaellum biogenesis ATPase FlaH
MNLAVAKPDYLELYSKYLDIKKVGNNYLATCPFHEDHNPSLGINPETGAFHCFGCGIHGNYKRFLELMGVKEMGEFKNSNLDLNNVDNVVVYVYKDLDGNELYKKYRYEKDGKKTFKIEPKGVTQVLYNLQQLAQKRSMDTEIWLAEGEKCAEALKPFAIDANAIVLGFNSFEVQYQEYLEEYFRQANIVIFEDNDETGYRNTKAIQKTLEPIVNTIRVVRFRGNPKKGYDIADFIQESSEEDFWVLLDNADYLYKNVETQKYVIDIEALTQPIPEPQILLPELLNIPKGVIGILASRGGEGKSMFSLYCAIYGAINEGLKTTFISLEDSYYIILYRIKHLIDTYFDSNYEAIAGKIVVERINHINLLKDGEWTRRGNYFFEKVEEHLTNSDLVFIDPVGMLFSDENNNEIIEAIFQRLMRLTERTNGNIVMIHHLRKKDNDSKEGLRGAAALFDNSRWVALLHRYYNGVKVRIIKNNYLPMTNNNEITVEMFN